MTTWLDYEAQDDSTVTGTLKVATNVYSPQLDNKRTIWVWLPPSYETDTERRFPVLYMYDGQNLFDDVISHVGEWGVDETLTALAEEGIEWMVVGLQNMEEERIIEYNPFVSSQMGEGKGRQHTNFLLNTIKPMIDSDFRTLTGVENTAIAGSSLGGLMSLYALFHGDEQIFGAAGIFSPFFGFSQDTVYAFTRHAPFRPAKIYMDVGTQECDNMDVPDDFRGRCSEMYLEQVGRMRDLLAEKGYFVEYVVDEGAIHHEDAWAKRLPDALRHLLRIV